MSDDTLSRRLARLLPAAGSLLCALAAIGPAQAQQVPPGQAPPAWIAYAQTVSTAVQARLESDEPIAVRLRTYLNQLPGAAESQGTDLKIAFWIDGKGKISRIEHAPFASAEPNDDLQALMVGLTMPQAPPKDMLLPLRLSIRIKSKPAAQPELAPAAMTISLRYRLPAEPPQWS